MPECSNCGTFVATRGRCQMCRVEHQHGTLADRRDQPTCHACGNPIPPGAPTASIDGQPAHTECKGQVRCDGGTETVEALEPPFWCPWCEEVVADGTSYDHAYEHRDKGPYAADVEELLIELQEDAPDICDHCGEVIDEPDEPADGSVAAEVLDALHEEGEVTASELELVTEVGSVYHGLRQLVEDDLVAKRPDPDDGRRTLYRPADLEVDESDGDQDQDQDQDETEESADVWCGICGKGPYERISTHATKVHDGDVVPLDHEPTEDELVGDDPDEDDPEIEELPELEGRTIPEHVTFDAVHEAVHDCDSAWGVANAIEWDRTATRQLLTKMELLNELPSPNARPDKVSVARDGGDYTEPDPYEIVDQSGVPARLDLPDLLDAAEDCDTLREAAEELGVGRADLLTEAYWRLDLKEEGRPRFVEDVDERVEQIRQEVGA